MRFNPEDPKTWDCFRPLIIAHDVGRSRDRSTAVIGGLPAFNPNLIAIRDAHELPQGSYGSARVALLAAGSAAHAALVAPAAARIVAANMPSFVMAAPLPGHTAS